MAPKTKATKARLANLNKAPKTSTAKLSCPGDIRDHYHLNQANVDHVSDSLEPKDFFDVLGDEGLGCRSDLPDSDAEEAPEICEDDTLLWFSQFLSKAQEDAAKGERSRWKEKKCTQYCGNSDRTKRRQAQKCQKIAEEGDQPFISCFFQSRATEASVSEDSPKELRNKEPETDGQDMGLDSSSEDEAKVRQSYPDNQLRD